MLIVVEVVQPCYKGGNEDVSFCFTVAIETAQSCSTAFLYPVMCVFEVKRERDID